jgi:hypothetical protein
MTEGMASRRQVVVGVVLGILLLPLPVVLEFVYFHGTERTLDVVFHAMVFFGAIQAFAILPASLCFYVAGKHGPRAIVFRNLRGIVQHSAMGFRLQGFVQRTHLLRLLAVCCRMFSTGVGLAGHAGFSTFSREARRSCRIRFAD